MKQVMKFMFILVIYKSLPFFCSCMQDFLSHTEISFNLFLLYKSVCKEMYLTAVFFQTPC